MGLINIYLRILRQVFDRVVGCLSCIIAGLFDRPAEASVTAVPAVNQQPDIEPAVFVSCDVRVCHGSIYLVIPIPEQGDIAICIFVNHPNGGDLAGPCGHVLREAAILIVDLASIVKATPQGPQFDLVTYHKPAVILGVAESSAFCVIEAVIKLFSHG